MQEKLEKHIFKIIIYFFNTAKLNKGLDHLAHSWGGPGSFLGSQGVE